MITILFQVFYFLVIALHGYFVVLEMVLWKRKAPKVFRVSQEYANQSASLASNQGLYNGFLVVALLIGLLAKDANIAHGFIMYGLLCVIAAGVWGGITVNKRITIVQALPALAALILYTLQN